MPCGLRGFVVLLLTLSCLTAHAADPLPQIIDANRDGNRAEADVQREIDSLSETRRALFEEYDALSRELESLSVYNAQLQRMLDDQDSQIETRESTLAQLADTSRNIMPLILQMADWLDQLSLADQPARAIERRRALAELRLALNSGDLDLGTRYELVLQEYARAIAEGQRVEITTGTLPGDDQQVVEFLHIGRLALFYQTPDGGRSGFWDPTLKQWVTLNDNASTALGRAMRVTRKELPPQLLQLPLQAPVDQVQGVSP